MFANEPWYFYLAQLIELSPFYILALLAFPLAFWDERDKKGYVYILITAFLLLLFYMLWTNYQSRYITAVTVPLVILSAKSQMYLWNKANKVDNKAVKYSLCGLMILCAVYFALKTLRVDVVLAVPNSVCYF